MLLAHLLHVDHKLGLVACQIQICVLLDLEGWLILVQYLFMTSSNGKSKSKHLLRSESIEIHCEPLDLRLELLRLFECRLC